MKVDYRTLVVGDTHANINHVYYLFQKARAQHCDRIVQVGDYGYWPREKTLRSFHPAVGDLAERFDIDFFWLDGNHEDHDSLEKNVDVTADSPQPMGKHVWYLPRAATWEWDGCRFMALGGAWSIDQRYRTMGVSWFPQELLSKAQTDKALDISTSPNVLLTHDAPLGTMPDIVPGQFPGDYDGYANRMAITAVMEKHQPRLLIHGHYHRRYTATLGSTHVEGLSLDGTAEESWIVINPEDWRS